MTVQKIYPKIVRFPFGEGNGRFLLYIKNYLNLYIGHFYFYAAFFTFDVDEKIIRCCNIFCIIF